MQDFTNEAIDINILPKYEETILKSLSSKYWNVVLINLIIVLFLIAVVTGLILWFNEASRTYLYIIIGIYALFSFLLINLYRIALKRRGFAVREKDIIYTSGVLSATTTIVPFNRVQHVALNEGIFSRIYKLGTLEVFTAGGISGNLKVHGLEIEEANKLKELLLKRVEYAG